MTKKISFGSKQKEAPGKLAKADEWVKNRQSEGTAEMKRLTIDVPADLHARVKSQCALRGIKMNDAIRELLEKNFPIGNK